MGAFQGKTYNTPEEAEAFIKETVEAHPVVMFTFRFSPYCFKAKSAFKSINVQFHEVLLSGRPDRQVLQDAFEKMTGARTMPRVFVHGKCIGGGDETQALNKEKKLEPLVKGETEGQEKNTDQAEGAKSEQTEVKTEQTAEEIKPEQTQETSDEVASKEESQTQNPQEAGDQQKTEDVSEQKKDES